LSQRHQRQRAALAVIVGPQQQQHVFRRDHNEQRPQDQRENAEHDGPRDRLSLRRRADSLAKGIKRRRSDVAKDHADTSQRQGPKAGRDRPFLRFR
jgi:hypothetical protein